MSRPSADIEVAPPLILRGRLSATDINPYLLPTGEVNATDVREAWRQRQRKCQLLPIIFTVRVTGIMKPSTYVFRYRRRCEHDIIYDTRGCAFSRVPYFLLACAACVLLFISASPALSPALASHGQYSIADVVAFQSARGHMVSSSS